MKSNVGGIDRILRIVLGLVLIGLAATGTVGLWGWIGVVPLDATMLRRIKRVTDTLNRQGLRVVAVSTVSLVTVSALLGVPSLGQLFTDGFETGNASRWSVRVP